MPYSRSLRAFSFDGVLSHAVEQPRTLLERVVYGVATPTGIRRVRRDTRTAYVCLDLCHRQESASLLTSYPPVSASAPVSGATAMGKRYLQRYIGVTPTALHPDVGTEARGRRLIREKGS